MSTKRYHIYEGTRETREEGDRNLTLKEALRRAKYSVQTAKEMGYQNYVAHVIDTATGEFIHTEEFNFYDAQEAK